MAQAEGSAKVRGLAPPTGRPGGAAGCRQHQVGLGWRPAPRDQPGPRPTASSRRCPVPQRPRAGRGRPAWTPSRDPRTARRPLRPGRAPEPRALPRRVPGANPSRRAWRARPSGLRLAHSPVADHHALDGLHGRGPGGRGREPSCGEMPGAAAAADRSRAPSRAAGDSRAPPSAGRGDSRTRPAWRAGGADPPRRAFQGNLVGGGVTGRPAIRVELGQALPRAPVTHAKGRGQRKQAAPTHLNRLWSVHTRFLLGRGFPGPTEGGAEAHPPSNHETAGENSGVCSH